MGAGKPSDLSRSELGLKPEKVQNRSEPNLFIMVLLPNLRSDHLLEQLEGLCQKNTSKHPAHKEGEP